MLRPRPEKGKNVLKCSCGYVKKDAAPAMIEKIKREEVPKGIMKEHAEALPLTDADCPKCGNGKARYWLIQTRAGDEPETKFLRCDKCKFTWRDKS